MEYRSLPSGNYSEPKLSVGNFKRRCETLAKEFSKALGLRPDQVSFLEEISEKDAFMRLGGRASEVITRNLGGRHCVVKLSHLSNDTFAWVGFREKWQRIGGSRSYRFLEGGFTIHIGKPGEVSKPQIMRSEWVGRGSSAFHDQVGHPHWQLDVLQTARSHAPEGPKRFDDLPDETAAKEFGRETEPAIVSDPLLGLTLERMHLASAAPWWQQPMAPIANAPTDVAELNRWILGCVTYMRQEVKRCEIVGQ